MSNVKQIGLAFEMYQSDYDGTYMDLCMNHEAGPDNWIYWDTVLQPYIKTYKIYHCPSVPVKGEAGFEAIGYGAVLEVLGYAGGLSYGWDAAWMGHPINDCPGFGQVKAVMHKPSENILVADGTRWLNEPAGGTWQKQIWAKAWRRDPPKYCASSRHNEMCNAVFADGHAKALKQGVKNAPSSVNVEAGAGEWMYWHFH